jgi:hypothetical protein
LIAHGVDFVGLLTKHVLEGVEVVPGGMEMLPAGVQSCSKMV